MIKNIIELLTIVEGESENIKIAKGHNKYPNSLKEAYNQFKKELKNG